MSPSEKFEQVVSFTYGNNAIGGHGLSKEETRALLLELACACGHPWKYHIYGEERCVIKDCSCQKFNKVRN